MDSKALDAILKKLPPAQRETAVQKITLAETCGYFGFELWTWGGTPHHADLVGYDAHGRLCFLAEPRKEEDE